MGHAAALWDEFKDFTHAKYPGTDSNKDLTKIFNLSISPIMHMGYFFKFMTTWFDDKTMILDTIYRGVHIMAYSMGKESAEILKEILHKVALKSECRDNDFSLCFD